MLIERIDPSRENQVRIPVEGCDFREDTGLIEGTAHEKVLEHIATVGLANVSQATLDALKPFFIPAHQEGSYERASVGAHDKSAARAAAPQGTKAGWTAELRCRGSGSTGISRGFSSANARNWWERRAITMNQ